jgi:dienelactone hydrolase
MKPFLRMPSLLILSVIMMLFSSDFVHAADDKNSDVKKSWDNAKVFVPGSKKETTPDKIKVEKPLPVVIYMHGCTGLTSESSSWGDFIKELGYIAILPDSMARDREINCDPKTKKGGAFPRAHAMRLEEIRYAFDQTRKSPWADSRNVFLMGHSEGGVATARTKLDGLNGIIISGWRCTNTKSPSFDGIFAPLDTPVLTLEWNRDDWQNDATKGSCADKFGERKKARQILFPGNGHNVFEQSKAREALSRFLKENMHTGGEGQ